MWIEKTYYTKVTLGLIEEIHNPREYQTSPIEPIRRNTITNMKSELRYTESNMVHEGPRRKK